MTNLQLFDLLKGSTFPNEPLDEKDRKIIESAYKHGHEGVGFNKFVQELKPFASRSTIAFRVERLCKLGYLERISKSSPKDVRPVRVSFKCFSVLSVLEQLRKKTAELVQRIKQENLRQKEEQLGQTDVDSFRKWYQELREDWNGCFGMVGSIAVFYGESAASDLFLPLMIGSYSELASEFFSLLSSKPNRLELMQEITSVRLVSSGTSLQGIKEQVASQMNKWNMKTP